LSFGGDGLTNDIDTKVDNTTAGINDHGNHNGEALGDIAGRSIVGGGLDSVVEWGSRHASAVSEALIDLSCGGIGHRNHRIDGNGNDANGYQWLRRNNSDATSHRSRGNRRASRGSEVRAGCDAHEVGGVARAIADRNIRLGVAIGGEGDGVQDGPIASAPSAAVLMAVAFVIEVGAVAGRWHDVLACRDARGVIVGLHGRAGLHGANKLWHALGVFHEALVLAVEDGVVRWEAHDGRARMGWVIALEAAIVGGRASNRAAASVVPLGTRDGDVNAARGNCLALASGGGLGWDGGGGQSDGVHNDDGAIVSDAN